MSGCVGIGPSALLFPGARDAVKTALLLNVIKGRSPSNGELSDFSFYIDSQISAHRKFKK